MDFSIPFDKIINICIKPVNGISSLEIIYSEDRILTGEEVTIVLPGITENEKCIKTILSTKEQFFIKLNKKRLLEANIMQKQEQIQLQKENNSFEFYEKCYKNHIKENTPIYTLVNKKNKIAAIYIGEDKSLNFLKIDGYSEEDNNGVIEYDDIHYYEKAGNTSYVSDFHGNFSNYGGSITGGNFSKIAAVGGGLLFGLMGIALGTALTYEPIKQEPATANLTIDSDIKKIDSRNVILNFYSESKKQFIDIELPQDIYNFLQTYLPDKKLGIVEEIEKKAAITNSVTPTNNTTSVLPLTAEETIEKHQKIISSNDFKLKIEKLKMMQDAGLLSDNEFDIEKKKLLEQI